MKQRNKGRAAVGALGCCRPCQTGFTWPAASRTTRLRLLSLAISLTLPALALPLTSRARTIGVLKSLLAFGHQLGDLPFAVGTAVKLPPRKDRLSERILPEAASPHEIIRARAPREL